MTNKEVLNELYRKHTTWILMAEKLVPEYYSVTAEDIVQDVYIKIYDELRENKLKTTTIIKEGSPHYGIMYLRIRNIVVDMMRKDKPLYTNNKQDFEDKQIQSEAEFFENIDNVIDGFTWFHKKMFRLYSKKFQSIRKLSEATKISYKVVCKTVKECKEEIKKKINEK
tara:strand:+ start:92 stop:595 length:504 start_codon:yes stop_codon:yes gene_type:complete